MSRTSGHRKIDSLPAASHFKPQGVPSSKLEIVELQVDEYEAIRLADGERLYHEKAAQKMGVSRQTFGRILESARGKIADTLTHGKLLRILGGNVEFQTRQHLQCHSCEHDWQIESLQPLAAHCPNCLSPQVGAKQDGSNE